MTEFDPALHRMVSEQRWFEDFVLGERFVIPSRTMTAAVFAAFQTASGDAHPIHYDIEYCRGRGHPGLLAHGFQILCFTAACFLHRHGRARPGHPCPSCRVVLKTWMPGTSPGLTN